MGTGGTPPLRPPETWFPLSPQRVAKRRVEPTAGEKEDGERSDFVSPSEKRNRCERVKNTQKEHTVGKCSPPGVGRDVPFLRCFFPKPLAPGPSKECLSLPSPPPAPNGLCTDSLRPRRKEDRRVKRNTLKSSVT